MCFVCGNCVLDSSLVLLRFSKRCYTPPHLRLTCTKCYESNSSTRQWSFQKSKLCNVCEKRKAVFACSGTAFECFSPLPELRHISSPLLFFCNTPHHDPSSHPTEYLRSQGALGEQCVHFLSMSGRYVCMHDTCSDESTRRNLFSQP